MGGGLERRTHLWPRHTFERHLIVKSLVTSVIFVLLAQRVAFVKDVLRHAFRWRQGWSFASWVLNGCRQRNVATMSVGLISFADATSRLPVFGSESRHRQKKGDTVALLN